MQFNLGLVAICLIFTLTNITCSPVPPAIPMLSAIQQKCPGLSENSQLLKQNEELLRVCKNWTSIESIKHVSEVNQDNVRCLLYYDTLTMVCAGLTDTIEQKDIIPDLSEVKQNKYLCDNLTTILQNKQFEHDLKDIVKSTRICTKICYDIEDNLSPFCGLSYYFAILEVKQDVVAQKKVGLPPQTDQNNQNKNLAPPLAPVSGHVGITNHFPQPESNDQTKTAPDPVLEVTKEQEQPKEQTIKSNVEALMQKKPAHTERNDNENPLDNSNQQQKAPETVPKKEPAPEEKPAVTEKEQPSAVENSHPSAEGIKPPNAVGNKPPTGAEIKPPSAEENKPLGVVDKPSNSVNDVSLIKIKQDNQKSTKENTAEKLPNENVAQDYVNADVNEDAKLDDAKLDVPNGNEGVEIGILYNQEKGESPESVAVLPPDNAQNGVVIEADQKNGKPIVLDDNPANYNSAEDLSGDSYFLSYFTVTVCLFFVGYVGYHNRQKILALLLEGKKGRRSQRNRRPNSANYHKLDSNLEEALTSSCNKNNSHIIY